jgi:hypothetical protein
VRSKKKTRAKQVIYGRTGYAMCAADDFSGPCRDQWPRAHPLPSSPELSPLCLRPMYERILTLLASVSAYIYVYICRHTWCSRLAINDWGAVSELRELASSSFLFPDNSTWHCCMRSPGFSYFFCWRNRVLTSGWVLLAVPLFGRWNALDHGFFGTRSLFAVLRGYPTEYLRVRSCTNHYQSNR